MNKFGTVPCYQCICAPICRHKSFHTMYFDCNLISNYFCTGLSDHKYTYTWLEDILKPTKWKVDPKDCFKVIPRYNSETK